MKLPRLKSLSRLKKYLIGCFLLLSIFIATLSSLMSTQTGSHWVVRKFAKSFDVKIGALNGNLLSGLDVKSFAYQQNGIAVQGENLSFRWQPSGLFYASVNVQSLSAEKLRISLPPSKQEPEPENYQWPSLAQPVRIRLANISLRDIEIRQGETLIPLSAITGSLGLGTLHLRARNFTVENNQGKVNLNGLMALRYPYGLDVKADWQFSDKSLPVDKLAGLLNLTGDIKNLKLEQAFSQPLDMKLTANISPALHDPKSSPTAKLSLVWPEQNLPPEWETYINVKLNTDPQDANAPKKTLKGTTKGQVDLAGWINEFVVSAHAQAGTNTNHLVLAGTAQVNYKDQEKLVHAHVENLNLLAQTKPESAQAKGEVESSNAILLKGDIRGFETWRWDFNVRTEHFNLNQFIAEWPSDLTASVNVQGAYEPQKKMQASNGLSLVFKDIDAQGDLRGLAVSAHGQVDYDGSYWSSSDANLAIGANQLLLKGTSGDALNLEWKLDAPLLGQIDPGVRGSILSSGRITGKKAEPRINIKGQVNNFSWRDYAVNNLSLSLAPKADTQEYDLLLDGAHLQVAGQPLSRLAIKGQGALAKHNVELQAESPSLGIANLKLNSSWENEIWRGNLQALTLGMKKMPQWVLSSATQMEINTQATKKSADLGKLCLTTKTTTQEPPMLCVQGGWSPAAGLKVDASLAAVPVNQLQAWLKPEAVLNGALDGEIKLQAPAAKPMVMDAHLRTRDVQLLYQFQGGKVETYPLQKGSLDVSIKNNQLSTILQMDWAPYGLINADGKYSLKDKKIQGKFSAALNDLAPLESMLPFLNDVQGSASANINVAGTADKPEVFGNISVTNSSANLPRLGLILRDMSLQVNAQRSGQVHVEGQITSGDGTLMVRGDLENLGTPQWAWQSNIYGANIRFIEQPQMVATLSPNLKLSANASAINLTGSTEIPWARAALKTLPSSATRVSSDVVVIENEQQFTGANAQKSIPFFTNVILYFGDDVRFKGFGLDTQLLGKVNVLKEENRQTFVTGFVAVGKGNYKAYGQDLVIERGRLIFQGPYDNPGLDIRATRVLDEGMAGLEIGGTLQHPKSSVFAIPAATDSQAMAMLLTGKALSESSQADAYSLIGAISSLGMDNGEGMTSDIAHFFHIDEITVKADKGLDQSALWMGKYVTPKLFIRYIVGLFDQTFSLGVRYQLSEKLRLEAESGKNQSVDVIYKIER
jgi:translocation and assembly module TamB